MAVSDKWDRANLEGHYWMYLSPGMFNELTTMTTEEVIALANPSRDDGTTTLRAIHEAKPGDWYPLKDGVVIRLGIRLDPT